MDDYNATIIFKCFSNELDYIYGLYAIKSELKRLNMINRCEFSKRKYLRDRFIYAGANENWCNNCVEPGTSQNHMKFNYHQLVDKNDNNYFNYLPDEIMSIIFNNLNEYEILNFYIAIQKCDMENFKKFAYWGKVRCESCKYIKKKYFNCNTCKLRLCSDCTKKCTYCDNRISLIKYNKNDLYVDNSAHYLDDYDDYDMNYEGSCLDEWSTCGEAHRYVEYFPKCDITETQYDWHFCCKTCKESICRNCIEHESLSYDFECKNCYVEPESKPKKCCDYYQNLSNKEWPILK